MDSTKNGGVLNENTWVETAYLVPVPLDVTVLELPSMGRFRCLGNLSAAGLSKCVRASDTGRHSARQPLGQTPQRDRMLRYLTSMFWAPDAIMYYVALKFFQPLNKPQDPCSVFGTESGPSLVLQLCSLSFITGIELSVKMKEMGDQLSGCRKPKKKKKKKRAT